MGILIDVSSVILLILLGIVTMSVLGGYANVMDMIALALHRHATTTRKRHEAKRIEVVTEWAREDF